MKKFPAAIAASLVTGFALGAWMLQAPDVEPDASRAPEAAVYFDASAATDERLRALEVAVGEERNARQLLEEELRVILDELDRLIADRERADREQAEQERVVNSLAASDARGFREAFQQRRDERFSPEARAQALIDAGFAPDRAALILQRESQLQMDAMQARFEARRTGVPINRDDVSANPGATLRAELGDADYERYLQANNRSVSVAVSSVLESSPAQGAGLQAGDRIVSYDGQRVFNVFDLNSQTIQGTPGENVVVAIERDGIPMQVVLPRGPLGITGGGR